MKISFAKLLFLGSVAAGIGIGGMVIWELVFHLQERPIYGWATKALDKQTLHVTCGKVSLYYLGFQDPAKSIPVYYQQKLVDQRYCANIKTPVQQFRFLSSPSQKCQQIDQQTWRCQGDMVPAMYERQQSRR